MLRHWRRMLLAVVALPAVAVWGGENVWSVNAFFGLYVAAAVVTLSITFELAMRSRSRSWRMLAVLELAGFTVTVIYATLGSLGPAVPLLSPDTVGKSLAEASVDIVLGTQFVLAYWAFVYVFPYAADDARLHAIEVDRLRRVAELARLRANLEPHFLLNTLNAIAGLVSQDPTEARRLLACLGDLLRDALSDHGVPETLGDQVEWLQRYADILESRHFGALRFSWEIDARARGLAVPRLLLQPLVENAVSHGALRRADEGHVVVRARLRDDASGPRLVCEVEDDGPGIAPGPVRHGAKGLALVRSRLDSLHPEAQLRLEPGYPGTRAIVEIPLGGHRAGKGAWHD